MTSPAAANLRFLVVDDHPFFREGLVNWINRQGGWECVGVADTIANARASLAKLQPDIVLLDLKLRQEDGLALLAEVPESARDAIFIVLTQSDELVYAERALRAGARGFIMKEEATDSVRDAVNLVRRKGVYVSRRLAARFLHRVAGGNPVSADPLEGLSAREQQVLALLGAGTGIKEAADILGVSPKTAEAHRDNLRRKLNLPDATSVVRMATLWWHEGRI
jgi:DNA-binding NarL/FixJ family response regulator